MVITNRLRAGLRDGSPIKNGHDALQSLEAINMLPAKPAFPVKSSATHFNSAALKLTVPNLP